MDIAQLKTPEEIKQELDKLSDDMSEAKYKANLLELNNKILIAKLTINQKTELECSITEAEKRAYASKDYLEFAEGLSVAVSNYEKLKAKYNNYLSYIEYMRSWISCQKHLN